jgi:SAM-dependent methyltransferase
VVESKVLRNKWDTRYRESERQPEPARILLENLHLLPAQGRALDLACGLGASALLLAERDLKVHAWDLSPVAIEKLEQAAEARGIGLRAAVRDVLARPPEPDRFDLILVSHFLDRDLAPAIAAALRPGGLLFYQTFVRDAVPPQGPSNPAYRLQANELLRLFPDLLVRFYREEGRVGDLSLGSRDMAQLIAQRSAQSQLV